MQQPRHQRPLRLLWLVAACAFAGAQPGTARQTVPSSNGAPTAPAGFEPQPVPAEPIGFDTAKVMRIRGVPVARGEDTDIRAREG